MNAVAVSSVSDNPLKSPGLTRKGDIWALKSFCKLAVGNGVSLNRKLQLIESIRMTSQDTSNNVKPKKVGNKCIMLGICYTTKSLS